MKVGKSKNFWTLGKSYRWPIPNFLSLETGNSVGIVRNESSPSSVVVNKGDSHPLANVAAETFLRVKGVFVGFVGTFARNLCGVAQEDLLDSGVQSAEYGPRRLAFRCFCCR